MCFEKNVCTFKDVVYQFEDGLPMGNPFSPLVADVYMTDIEAKLRDNQLYDHVLLWRRYVDDVFCVWNGPDTTLQLFLNLLNSFHPPLQFTLEVGDRLLNFFDITITLKEEPTHLTPAFDIFRKPSHTGRTIHGFSLHSRTHKLAVYHSMIHRLLSIPLTAASFNKEVYQPDR